MTACTRPGCGGQLDEDGFCDTCGLEPPAPVSTSTPPSMSTPSSRTSSRPTAVTSWTTPTGGVTSRSRRVSTRSTNRGLLGRGIVDVPRVPKRDPREAVLTNPEVPENKRFCSKCGTKVGRGREGRPGRVEGFCAKCGHHFDFTPKLDPGLTVEHVSYPQ